MFILRKQTIDRLLVIYKDLLEIMECLFLKLNSLFLKLYYKGPDLARKQVCRNYDVIFIMMFNSKWQGFKFEHAFSVG